MHQLDSSMLTRDLEILLDQLYYWAKRAEEPSGNGEDDGLAGRMLETATSTLETFVTTLLDCVRPLELAPIRVPASDLVSAIVVRARSELGAASVTVSGEADGTVSLDAVHLTRALSTLLRRLDPRGGGVHVAVSRAEGGGRSGIEVALRSDTRRGARVARHVMAELEWALAGRIVALHSGEVHEHTRPRSQTITLFLPMAP